MKRSLVVIAIAVVTGCHAEPLCDHFEENDTSLNCEPIDICCQGPECWYETQDGTRFDCDGNGNCQSAAAEVVCATCEGLGETTSNDIGC